MAPAAVARPHMAKPPDLLREQHAQELAANHAMVPFASLTPVDEDGWPTDFIIARATT